MAVVVYMYVRREYAARFAVILAQSRHRTSQRLPGPMRDISFCESLAAEHWSGQRHAR